jgi:predicted metal-dependent phosphoesterase TrpH
MRCDLHVHSYESGMCRSRFLERICRECYSPPEEVYATLKRRGMDLVTLTDHDSIDGAEALRRYPDFFVSEEVTCHMPSGTEIHVGVYDITERQHIEVQRRRDDLISLLVYLTEKRLFFSINHMFSSLTGRREFEDFAWFEQYFPAVETLNGHMLARSNRHAARLARRLRKTQVGGSDAHTLASLATAYTEVHGARSKEDFFAGLRNQRSRAAGESGNYWKLTRDVLLIAAGMMREQRWTALLAPLALLVPAAIAANHAREAAFVRHWAARLAPHPGICGPAAFLRLEQPVMEV